MSTFNTVALANNWNVNADPFYAMKGRSGFDLAAISSITPVEAITAVLGDELASKVIKNGKIDAANKVQGTLFAAWCYLRLRQKNHQQLECPVGLDELFAFPQPGKVRQSIAGLDLMKQIGRYVAVPNTIKRAMSEYKAATEGKVVDQLARQYGLSKWAVKQGILTGCYAAVGTNLKLLTYKANSQLIEDLYGDVEGIVYVDPQWCNVMDFLVSQQDVALVCDWLAGALSKGGKSPIEVAEGESGAFRLWIDSHEFLVTAKDGVFEMGRNRRFNNMLLVDSLTGYASDRRVRPKDLSLVNSYGSFLYGLLMLSAPYLSAPVPELGQFVNKVLCTGEELPMTSEDEVGAADADRVYYERYVTVSRVQATSFPFSFNRCSNGYKVSYTREVNVAGLKDVWVEDDNFRMLIKAPELPAKSAVDRAALMAFNLVRMPRGQFIDGRRSCIRAWDVPEALRGEFVINSLAELAGGTSAELVAAYARSEFKLSGADDKVINQLGCELIIGLSSKLAKLIKRTAMSAALVGHIAGGESRGLKQFGQPSVSSENWLVEAVVSPHATFPAGMAAFWGKSPVMEVKHTSVMQPNVPIKDVENAVMPFFSGVTSRDHEWFVYTFDEKVVVDQGEVVADVPFTTDLGVFQHSVINKTPDAQLVELRWRAAKVNGNGVQLQIKMTVLTHEEELKGRNNVKCMMSRYTPGVVHNELNSGLVANSVFFADTNKWLDLVQSLSDVAACTAIKNQDAEGLRLITEANARAGRKGCECLEWSPVLASIGVYRKLTEWFESKYGRSVWFKHEDATHEWVNVLRRIYTQHNVEGCENEPVKGWNLVPLNEIEFALPAGAENVLAVGDGGINDPKVNVLVMYELNGVSFFVQRAWSYVGSESTGAVWQPVKGELSSVRSSVGKSPLMAGVARAIEPEDATFAMKLAKGGSKGVMRSAVLYAMAANQTIKAKGGSELPLVELGSTEAAELLQTEELIELASNPANAGRLLELLAPMFKNVMLRVNCGSKGAFSVYLPVVLAQDANSNFASSEGLSDLITGLVVQAIQGVNVKSDAYLQLASRAKFALMSLVKSEGLVKAASQCQMAVQAKTVSLPGIPVGEVWVRESERANSVYKTMQRVYA